MLRLEGPDTAKPPSCQSGRHLRQMPWYVMRTIVRTEARAFGGGDDAEFLVSPSERWPRRAQPCGPIRTAKQHALALPVRQERRTVRRPVPRDESLTPRECRGPARPIDDLPDSCGRGALRAVPAHPSRRRGSPAAAGLACAGCRRREDSVRVSDYLSVYSANGLHDWPEPCQRR